MSKADSKTITKETFEMAWPSVLESVLVSVAGMVDTFMVSGLGKAAVSAVGVTNQPKYFVFTTFFAINTAMSLLVARKVGERRRKDANGLFLTAFLITLGLCFLLSILCVVFAEPFMRLAGANNETIGLSVTYFRIIMGGSIFNILLLFINAVQRGSGNTRLAMSTNIVSNVINLVMDYLLIGGHFGFPKLGVVGAAVATVLGTVVACFMSVRTLFLNNSFVQVQYIREENIKPTKEYAMELIPVGSTILSENILSRFGMMVTSSMTARIGTAPFAAHLVGMNFMSLGFAFGDGLQAAAIALVGRSIGEGDIERAKHYTSKGLFFGLCISSIGSVLMLMFNQQIFGLYFPNEPEMLAYGQLISRFFAVILPIQVLKTVYAGVLRGAGDVRFTMIASTISITLLQPAALYVLNVRMNMGLAGVWTSILLSQALQLILFSWRYYSGGWLKHVS